MFQTSVHAFFPDLSRAYNMVLAIEDKIVYGNDLKGKKLLRVSGRFEPYREFELPGVKLQ